MINHHLESKWWVCRKNEPDYVCPMQHPDMIQLVGRLSPSSAVMRLKLTSRFHNSRLPSLLIGPKNDYTIVSRHLGFYLYGYSTVRNRRLIERRLCVDGRRIHTIISSSDPDISLMNMVDTGDIKYSVSPVRGCMYVVLVYRGADIINRIDYDEDGNIIGFASEHTVKLLR